MIFWLFLLGWGIHLEAGFGCEGLHRPETQVTSARRQIVSNFSCPLVLLEQFFALSFLEIVRLQYSSNGIVSAMIFCNSNDFCISCVSSLQ